MPDVYSDRFIPVEPGELGQEEEADITGIIISKGLKDSNRVPERLLLLRVRSLW